jgi:hypothetical protein
MQRVYVSVGRLFTYGSCFACRSFHPLDSFEANSFPMDAEIFTVGVFVTTFAAKEFAGFKVIIMVNDDSKRALVGVIFPAQIAAEKQAVVQC